MNKTKLLIIQFLFFAAGGLFAPAWYRYLIERSTADTFGVLLGIVALGSVSSAYLTGWMSSRWNTIKILQTALFLHGVVILCYLFSFGIGILFLLQVLFGVLSASILTLLQIIIAKTTNGEDKSIGLYNTALQAGSGIAMISSGFISYAIGDFGVIVISSVILFIASSSLWKW